MDPLAPHRGRDLDEAAYLRAIEELDFEGVTWDAGTLADVRDFLAPWHHNIRLPHGVHTAYWEAPYPAHEEMMSVIARELRGEFAGKRVLDLGCLEGYFAAECSLQGATVVAVEGKITNLKKCEFVRSALGIDKTKLCLVRDDVMNVTKEAYGSFDAVLALGLLYHLADPFLFLANVADACDGFILIDTHIAFEDKVPTLRDGWRPPLSPLTDLTFRGKTYLGRWYREFEAGTAQLAKDLSATASLTDESAVWLVEDSLVSLLHDVGFPQVAKISFAKSETTWWSDPEQDARVLYLASKRPETFHSRVFVT
jgi:SAM-dependent methyltransferase